MRPRRPVRARLIYATLLAFALRAFIPLGFMPASDGTLSLMICPAGLPAWLFQGHGMAMFGGMKTPPHRSAGHGQGLMDEGYCAFTTGFSSAPPPLLLAALALVLSCLTVTAVTVLAPAGIRLVHLPQARAPPVPR